MRQTRYGPFHWGANLEVRLGGPDYMVYFGKFSLFSLNMHNILIFYDTESKQTDFNLHNTRPQVVFYY